MHTDPLAIFMQVLAGTAVAAALLCTVAVLIANARKN